MSEGVEGGSLFNALKLKLIEEHKELEELRTNAEKYQEELKIETEKRAEVNECRYMTVPGGWRW